MAKLDEATKRVLTFVKRLLGISNRAAISSFYIQGYDGLIICNATRSGAEKVFGDRITRYCAGELSYHFVSCKNQEFFYDFLQWVVGDDLSQYEVLAINLANLSSTLSKHSMRALKIDTVDLGPVVDSSSRNLNTRIVSNWQKLSGTKNTNVLACGISDHQLATILRDTLRKVRSIGSREHLNNTAHFDLLNDPGLLPRQKEYVLDVDPSRLTGADTPLRDCAPLKLNVVDGLTLPSVVSKQFITPNTVIRDFNVFVWAEDDISMSVITNYEDDELVVRTYPINLHLMPFVTLDTIWEKV